MRTDLEIRDHLLIGRTDDLITEQLLKEARQVEFIYARQLETGELDYGLYCDFVNSPFILEDEDDVEELVMFDQIGGIVVYKPIPRCEGELRIEPSQVYDYAVKMMKPEDIHHHGNGKGFDDLYLKVNERSKWIVEHMSNRSLLGTFISPIDGCKWFDFPFCYPVVD